MKSFFFFRMLLLIGFIQITILAPAQVSLGGSIGTGASGMKGIRNGSTDFFPFDSRGLFAKIPLLPWLDLSTELFNYASKSNRSFGLLGGNTYIIDLNIDYWGLAAGPRANLFAQSKVKQFWEIWPYYAIRTRLDGQTSIDYNRPYTPREEVIPDQYREQNFAQSDFGIGIATGASANFGHFYIETKLRYFWGSKSQHDPDRIKYSDEPPFGSGFTRAYMLNLGLGWQFHKP